MNRLVVCSAIILALLLAVGRAEVHAAGKDGVSIPELGAVAHEDWMTNRRGIEALSDDFVPPPFEPVKATTAGGVEVWGRRYELGPFGLVSQVHIHGEPFLAQPMELELEVDGKTVTFQPAQLHPVRKSKGKAEYRGRGRASAVDLRVTTTIEYDGMVRVDCSLLPKRPISVTGFRYRVAYPRESASLLRYDGARYSGMSVNLPRQSFSMAVPEGEGSVWKSDFKTQVWLGDLERGFLWFCASEQHWSPQERQDRPEALQVVRNEKAVELVIAPVTAPYRISEPITYTFGFFATPVRPLPAGWRGWTQTYETVKRGKVLYHPSPTWDFVSFYPRIRDVTEYQRKTEAARQNGQWLIPYLDPMAMSLGILKDPQTTLPRDWRLPDMDFDEQGVSMSSEFSWQPPEIKYFEQWRREPSWILAYGKEKGYRQFGAAIGSGWSDFYCYLVEQHAKAGARGIGDLDEWMAFYDMNPLHGAGYVDQHGVRRFDYDTFAKRDLSKRMTAIFLKEHGEAPLIVAHGAATLGMPFMSHATSILTGENMNTGYFVGSRNQPFFDEYFHDPDGLYKCLERGGEYWYHYAAPLDRWQAECLGKQFGFPILVMANLTKSTRLDDEYRKSVKATRDWLAMVVIHDNLSWPIFCHRDTVFEYWDVREQFGIADEQVQFHPYWNERRVAGAGRDGIYVSAYENGGKWLLAASNLSLEDWSGSLEIHERAFNKGSVTSAVDAVSKAKLNTDGLSIAIEIPARDYRLLFVR